ncbi:hypothetical protein ACFX2F_009594 [Malus domestica]
MCLQGFILNTLVQVFIDSGADQSFLNPQVVARLGLHRDSSRCEPVLVATGRYFRTKGVTPQVSVLIQGYELCGDFHLLVVPGCDMVWGIDWLETLGLIGWNFLLKVMEFTINGTNYRLVGSSTPPQSSCATSSALDTHFGVPLQIVAQLSLVPQGSLPSSPLSVILQALLLRYLDLFEPPTTLPPHRAFNHQIPFLPGTGPVNVHPYRYGHA